MGYESPINIIYGEINNKLENEVLTVIHNLGIDVDKEELVRALKYDREQYQKGYEDRDKEIVRCKDCKHRPKEPNFKTFENGFDIEFPEGSKCPCQCSGDEYYSWYPEDDWFCASGERKEHDI